MNRPSLQALRVFLTGTRAGALAKRLGIGRLALSHYEQRILRTGRHSLTLHGQHLTFEVHNSHEITCIDNFARFERNLMGRLISSVRDGDAFFDVGANIGVVAAPVALATRGRNVSVHAFEPDAQTAARTRRNLELSRCENTHVHVLALGATDGAGYLHVNRNQPDTASMIQVPGARAETIAVRVGRLDSVAARLGVRPSVIKIDVEGAEMEVLTGAEAMLRAGVVRELFVEIHPRRLRIASHDESELVAWLAGVGYRSVWREVKETQPQHHFRRATSAAGASPGERVESGQ